METTSFNIGDVLYSSWGYDQTNINFYQVIKVSEKTLTLRQIEGKVSEESGFMTSEKTPVLDKFRDNEFRKKIKTSYEGEKYIDISGYEYAQLWDGKPKTCTSYA
jgi:hypothetical protein